MTVALVHPGQEPWGTGPGKRDGTQPLPSKFMAGCAMAFEYVVSMVRSAAHSSLVLCWRDCAGKEGRGGRVGVWMMEREIGDARERLGRRMMKMGTLACRRAKEEWDHE